jgi:hypothetical protein
LPPHEEARKGPEKHGQHGGIDGDGPKPARRAVLGRRDNWNILNSYGRLLFSFWWPRFC